MAKTWRYGDTRKNIVLDEEPKQKLRITGHRIASVLGLNPYQTPFGAWAEICKVAKLPFEDNKYTIAGKAIEPKVIEYIKGSFPNIKSIEEYYGPYIRDYQWNNFIDDSNVFGGIIDAVSTGINETDIKLVVEIKTSSKPHEWANDNVPLSYLLQGCMYSRLKKTDKVLFVVSFLKNDDYIAPDNFVVTPENTKMIVKSLKDIRIPYQGENLNIDEILAIAEEWWNTYVLTGVSPEFDEKKDKEYLDIIRATQPVNDNDLESVCNQALALAKEIDELKISSGLKEKESQLKKLETNIKNEMLDLMNDSDDKISSGKYTLSKKIKEKFNEKRFKEENENVYNNYIDFEESYTLSKNKKDEGEDL